MAEIVFWCLIGILIGIAVDRKILREKPVGSLRVDRSDPEGPYLFLELEQDVDSVSKKNIITLKINRKDFIPHE